MSIATHLSAIRRNLPPTVELVAVSKYHPEADLREAYAQGQRDFGENIAQELHRKAQNLPPDIRWHFIGHLQTNKVRLIAPHVSLIHSVDSIHLLQAINNSALNLGKTQDCLLQIHIAREQTKFGLTPSDCLSLLDGSEWRNLTSVRIRGLMCIATNTSDTEQLTAEFNQMQTLFNTIQTRHFPSTSSFNLRSWGMSDDYPLAIECGSNMVRIGTAIFGPRPRQ